MILTPEQYADMQMNPKYMDIGPLPSNGKAYKWTNLYIRPFTLHELKLISRSASLGDPQPIIRAIDLTISEDVNDLTTGDYFYVMLWHKIHSYTKTPLIVEWPCDRPLFNRLRDGKIRFEPLTEQEQEEQDLLAEDRDKFLPELCGTVNSEPIHKVDVEVASLEDDFVLDAALDFPRVRNMVEVEEALKDPDLSWLIPSIRWLPGLTLEDKMKHFEDSEEPNLLARARKANDTVRHGINQKTTLHCRRCRTTHPYFIRLDPQSFFQ